ncbi:MAG: peptidase M15 [Chitinophagaceae bacterium]|nr:peptidase M15 [Chitinophagaceae bacterium]
MLYKILFHRNIPKVLLLFLALQQAATAQQTVISRYGVPVIMQKSQYETGVEKDSLHRMVELRKVVPGIVYDLRYGTKNNFTHRRMYPKNTNSAYLRLPAAMGLQKIQYELNAKGYGLKIFDAYRPYLTDSAHHDFTQSPRSVLDNRQLFKAIMEKYGFRALETEWWHYYRPNNRDYEVLDIPFNKLK